MKYELIYTSLILLYIFIAWRMYKICSPRDRMKDEIDQVLIPLASIFWPLAWTIVLGNEVVGYFRRILKKIQTKRRIAKKEKQRTERLKKMNP